MFDHAQTALRPAREVARTTPLASAQNGLRWASYGFTEVPADTLAHIVEAVPAALASALKTRAYYFVPLAIGEPQSPSASTFPAEDVSASPSYDETEIASGFSDELSDRATCHRTLLTDGVESTFISARLMQDKFALAFEFFINIGHQFVDAVPVPERFRALLWSQARAEIRGETSQDAYETRKRALESASVAAGTSQKLNEGQEEASLPHGADASAPLEQPASTLNQPVPGGDLSLDTPPVLDSARPRSAFGVALSRAAAAGTTASLFAVSENKLSLNRANDVGSQRSTHVEEAADAARTAYYEAGFADTLAIYMLSLTLDLDYADLREREYPLLAAPALADRLRLAADLYPPPPTYEFAIRYRRRH